MRTKRIWIVSAAVALALPAVAQQPSAPQPAPATPPPANQYPAGGIGATQPSGQSSPAQSASPPVQSSGAADESAVEEVAGLNLPPPPPPVEYPGWARRDPSVVGSLDPVGEGLGANPWGNASGAFLSTLMRRMHTPIASRWAHIALRNAVLAKVRAPRDVNPVDWVAERAWLLLRMGEADAARMLVSGVDTDRFTAKMVQVAVQSALANSDPAGLCPIQDGIRKNEPAVRALVEAMCSSLAGEPETASAQIDQARRFGRIGGIDLALAEKVVGAGANTGRAVTLEWNPVESLTAWRFGLATSTGLAPPDRLINAASPQLRAFAARAPLLSPQQRLGSAFIAAGLGVFSSQSMVDLYSALYDATDPSELPTTDAWQLRQAFIAKDDQSRVAALRRLLALGKAGPAKEGARAVVARAATMVEPDAELKEAPDLIAAMLAGGYDRAAARWIPAINGMDGEAADRCWALLALAGPNIAEVGTGRISAFIRRDNSPGRQRSALLVAGLAGLGRISTDNANALNRRYGLGIGHTGTWTRMIDAAAARGQAGTVLVLIGTGLQTPEMIKVPGANFYHAISALRRTGQDFTARMIAAEALSRT